MLYPKRYFRLLDMPLDDIASPELSGALRYWSERRGDAFAPPWSSFNLLDFSYAQLRFCIIVDLDAEGAPSHYRYFGSGIAEVHGFDLTRKTPDAIPDDTLRAHVLRQYRLITERRAPQLMASRMVLKNDRQVQRLILRLPLSDDGAAVTKVASFEAHGDFGLDFGD
jgi:hypothetical protein